VEHVGCRADGFGCFDALLGVRGLGDVLPTPRPRRTPICSTPSCRSAPASAARLYGLWSARRGTEVIVALGLDAVVGADLVTG
jgi:hypothetical protein